MTLKYEKAKIKDGYKYIIGCDEVGRGCLAGPVVAAAVIINPKAKLKDLTGIKDSKLLSREQREKLEPLIKQNFLWSIGVVSEAKIDAINIHNASLLAMKKAVTTLLSTNSHELVLGNKYLVALDGKFTIADLNLEQEAIVGGDNKILSIAAASIVAKVYRDKLMQDLDKDYPIYNFAQHKGYATEHHRKMVLQHGLSPIHRLSFCQNLSV